MIISINEFKKQFVIAKNNKSIINKNKKITNKHLKKINENVSINIDSSNDIDVLDFIRDFISDGLDIDGKTPVYVYYDASSETLKFDNKPHEFVLNPFAEAIRKELIYMIENDTTFSIFEIEKNTKLFGYIKLQILNDNKNVDSFLNKYEDRYNIQINQQNDINDKDETQILELSYNQL